MTGNATKAIAARVPFDEYIKILTAATEAKLNVSDYVIMKLNALDRTSDLETKLSASKAEVVKLKQELDKTKKDGSKSVSEMTAYTNKVQGYSKKVEEDKNVLNKTISDGQAKLKEWEKYGKDVESGKEVSIKEIARLSKMVETLSATVETQKQQLTLANKSNTDLTAVVAKGQSDLVLSRTDLKTVRADLDQAKLELSKVHVEITRIRARSASMYQTLADEHNNSGPLGTMKEKYWAVIEEFTNSLK